MRRAVVLSGSIGAGHDAVASACVAALSGAGVACETLDCMALLGSAGFRVANSLFRRALEVGPLYDAFHFSQLRAASPLARHLEAAASRQLLPAVADRLPAGEGLGLVAVFATGAGVAGRLRRDGRAPGGAVAVVTDAAAHALWVQPGIDRYVVFSPMAAGTVRQYDPCAEVRVVDPPVRPGFERPPGQDEARAELGLDPEGPPVVLLMGGAWGRGPLVAVAVRLFAAGRRVLVLAGANGRLAGALARASAGTPARASVPPPLVWGPRDDVARVMAAADVVVTPPGQSCNEARAVGRPLVVLDAVPGHGRENLLLEVARGGALGSPARPASVVAAVDAALAGRVPPAAPGGGTAWATQFLDALSGMVPPRRGR